MIQRGEIRWVSLRDPVGSEPGHRRPVLIVSGDRFNRSRIATVVAAVITSNVRLDEAPGNVLLAGATSGLGRDSVVNVSQLVTLNKADLSESVERLDTATMRMVEEGIALVLDLPAAR